MCAFVYALNDSDERVRHQAAVEISQQLRRNRCCCSDKVAQALMCALGDCDRKVRKAAEKGLHLCGYEVADACSMPCAVASCGSNGSCGPAASTNCGPAAATNCGPASYPAAAPANVTPAPAPAAAPAPAPEAAPAPAPPAAEPEAYFPARIREQQTGASRTRSTLANLFGLR
jgi:hypothetical protein